MKTLPYDLSREELISFTPKWLGERFEDGRPKVADKILDTIKKYVSITHAWQVCKEEGYMWQFLSGFESTLSQQVMVGRALTALYMPIRPDLREYMLESGHVQGEIGDMISWPIDRLVNGDVYVADVFGKINDGPIVGERLSSAVYANSQNGAIHNASVRDIEGITEIEGFNIYHRGMNPTHASPDTIMLAGINCPMRMEDITIMPGDVVLAHRGSVIFIPPHLAEFCAISGVIVWYKDRFSIQRMQDKTYTPGQIDAQWTDEIENDFLSWLQKQPNVPFSSDDMKLLDGKRTW